MPRPFKLYRISILLGILFLLSQKTYSQTPVTIKCNGATMLIPDFKVDSAKSFNSPVLVQMGILPSLKAEDSDFEVRWFYNTGRSIFNCLEIKCKNGKVTATSYFLEKTELNDESFSHDKSYRNVTPVASNRSFWLKQDTILKLRKKHSWNVFFSELIENHIGTLLSSDELVKVIKKCYPNIVGRGEGEAYLEVKAGRYIRNIVARYIFTDPAPLDVRDYLYEMNVFNLLNQVNNEIKFK